MESSYLSLALPSLIWLMISSCSFFVGLEIIAWLPYDKNTTKNLVISQLLTASNAESETYSSTSELQGLAWTWDGVTVVTPVGLNIVKPWIVLENLKEGSHS